MRMRAPMLLAAVLLVGVTVGVAADPTANVSSPPALTPETALASLNASIEWYRQARVTMREVNRSAGALFAQEDQETARQALQRAFAVVRARAALLKQAPDPATKPPAQERLAAARAQLEASRWRSVGNGLRATAEQLRPLGARLSALAESPDTAAAADAEREFQTGLARAKALTAILIPLREQASLLRRYSDDLRGWARAVDAETREVLKSLGLELLRLSVVIAIVLLAAVVWRFLALRYIADGYRRRLLMTVRTFVVTTTIALVIVFHFASELTPLVTALGFAAAGIAFALQNVILALVGYFAMLSPNGIRVGDRVSLQGPFAYVYGEVMEIGFLRIRLRELAGEPPTPTGRIVVFPNSVVFTGTFFKHPDREEAEPRRRSA